jgi:hypothetical protein
MRRTVLIVPCYNEASRLEVGEFRRFATVPGLSLLFVNDGSTDATGAILDRLADGCPEWASVLHLLANGGKAEAVRLGMLTALATGAEVVGYFDADLATPPAEMVRLLARLDDGPWSVALASRVRMLGTTIDGRGPRHFLARIFARLASDALGIDVHETQCGAKAFRRTPALEAALAEPFRSRWTLDVELIGRLLTGTPGVSATEMIEVPLTCWRDVAGSKLRLTHLPGILLGIWRSALDLRARRRALLDRGRESGPGTRRAPRPHLPLARIPQLVPRTASLADQAIGSRR